MVAVSRRRILHARVDTIIKFSLEGKRQCGVSSKRKSGRIDSVSSQSLKEATGKSSESGGSSMIHKFARQALYDLVWSQPMSKLAKNLGVSDVAVAKACRRAEIPVPGVGYWAK